MWYQKEVVMNNSILITVFQKIFSNNRFFFYHYFLFIFSCYQIILLMFSLSVQQERWIHGCSRAGLDSGRAWFTPAHALAEDEGDARAHRRGPPDRRCCFSLPQGGAVRIQRLLSGKEQRSSFLRVTWESMTSPWFVTRAFRPCLHVV